MGYEDLPIPTFDEKHFDALVQRVAAHGASFLREHRAGSPSPQQSRSCSRHASERRPVSSVCRTTTDPGGDYLSTSTTSLDAIADASVWASEPHPETSLLDSFATNLAVLRGELDRARVERECEESIASSAAAASSHLTTSTHFPLSKIPTLTPDDARALILGSTNSTSAAQQKPKQPQANQCPKHGSCTVDGACRRDVWLRGIVGFVGAGAMLLLC